MTIAIGFTTKDGIVFASDSQATDEDIGTKRASSKKLFEIKFKGGDSALLSRAGSIAGSDGFQEIFEEMAAQTVVNGPRVIADTAERALKAALIKTLDTARSVVRSRAAITEQAQDSKNALFLGYVFAGKPFIFETHSVAANPIRITSNFITLGSGRRIANAYLEQVDTTTFSLEEGAGFAAYIIDRCKQTDLYCSGETQLGLITNGGAAEVFGRELSQAVDRVSTRVHAEVQRVLLAQIRERFHHFPRPENGDLADIFYQALRENDFKASSDS